MQKHKSMLPQFIKNILFGASVFFLNTSWVQCNSLYAEGFNRPLVTLTFDDGNKSDFDTVFPLLQSYNIKATFYLTTADLGTPLHLSMDEAIALAHAGHEIGAHTETHPHLTEISSKKIKQELSHSKMILELGLHMPIKSFAPPYGEYSKRVLREIKHYFDSSRSVDPGFNLKTHFDPYKIKVQNIFRTTPSSLVEGWLEQASEENAWLVFVYHAIGDSECPYSLSQQNFEEHLRLIKDHALPTATISEALEEIAAQ